MTTTATTVVRAFGPGRVNLIGEHTDYNDGLALPFAIELGITVQARNSTDGDVHAAALKLGEQDSFHLVDPSPRKVSVPSCAASLPNCNKPGTRSGLLT